LAARHHVALLCLRAIDELPIDEILQARCEIAEEVFRPSPGKSLVQRWWWRTRLVGPLLQGHPMWASAFNVPAFATRARALAGRWHPDIVQMEYHVMAQYASALDSYPAPRVLTEYEPGTSVALERVQAAGGLARAVHYLDMLAWRRFERQTMKEVQAVVVLTERDMQALARFMKQTPAIQIPLGTMLPHSPLDPVGCPPLSVVFVGNFMHQPNVDAARYLICEILPQVWAHYPELLAYIVGTQPPLQLRQLASNRVVVTGHVPDVTPYLARAAVVVAPLRRGGGMRMKVLEALAAGKAVVASPLAVEGLDVMDGEHIVLAESDQQFSDAIVQLLAEPERRALVATRARTWACANLDWEQRIAAYEALYDSLMEPSLHLASMSASC
jgi:glycosyltransferase involved in cell wall biosynthesis